MLKRNSLNDGNTASPTTRDDIQKTDESAALRQTASEFIGAICPNCGARLEGRKCKLFCPTVGCGYLVTCSEW